MIDAVDVIRFVGPQTFGRARDVVRAGLVEDATWHDEDGSITATVSGSADDPYDVQVDTTIARGEFVRPVRSHCTCPLGGECKHVAAALLTINARALAAQAGPRTQAPTPPTPDWRRDLARLAGQERDRRHRRDVLREHRRDEQVRPLRVAAEREPHERRQRDGRVARGRPVVDELDTEVGGGRQRGRGHGRLRSSRST